MAMTQAEVEIVIDDYFNIHLDKDYWTGLTAEVRTACVSMAVSDVCVELNITELDPLNAPSLKAVAEQAVFLSRNYGKQKEGKVVISQTLPPGLSQSFKLLNGDNPIIAPRAKLFIKQAKAATSRTIRLVRG